jgi:hypothetical protein
VASWALAFNEQARAALLRLDAWLQEEILDELDRLAQSPGQLRRGGSSPVCIADLARDHDNRRHYVFLSIEANASSRTLEVVDVGHHSRPR